MLLQKCQNRERSDNTLAIKKGDFVLQLDKRKFLFHLNESMLGISSGLKHDSFIEVLLRFFQLLIDVLMYFFFCPLYFICKSIVLFILKLHQ